MAFKLLQRRIANLSLQSILTIPFLLQIFITVGLVGYFSFRNGQQAVNQVATKLRNEVTSTVQLHLQNYVEKPCLIVQLNQKAAELEQLSFDNWRKIETDLWRQIKIFDSVYAIYLANEAGKFAYVKRDIDDTFIAKPVDTVPQRQAYLLDEKGERSKFLESDRYDPRVRPWYITTTTIGRDNWTQIYTFAGGELGMTIGGELYDSKANFRGVVGVDLVLSRIGDFLESIKISDNGQVFILERNGYLVATSTQEEPFTYNAVNGTQQRLKAIDSQNLFTKGTYNYLIEYFGSLETIEQTQQLDFKLEGTRQLVQVLPYGKELGLDWLIVVVVPEADFMTDIHRNTRKTTLLCLGALFIATIIGVVTSRKIAQPIAHLSQVSSIIAQSARKRSTRTNLYPEVKAKNIKEIKILAQSFNEMTTQLKAAFKDLDRTNEELEIRVEQRTAALMSAKEAADAANLAKSEFLAHMSHELRTPLHAILGFTQVSLQDSSLNPQQRKNLNTIKRSGEHLLTLINDVLEMSKIESGAVSVKPQVFDFALLLANLAKMLKLRAREKNLHLSFSVSPQIPQYIYTDPIKLRQILINLLENSIKFTQEGKVSLKVSSVMSESSGISNKLPKNSPQKQMTLYFEVEDTGCGIAPSELDTIFDAFIQTKQSSHRKGTGLGLAISRQFVNLLGGKISVNSVLNQGSIFKFYIPVTLINQSNLPTLLISQKSPNLSQAASVKTNTNNINKTLSTSSVTKIIEPKPSTQINSASLTIMPPKWIAQLKQAAIEIDADSIRQLIKQIPSHNTSLTQGLNSMLEKFEYDEIIQLTEM
ncbi:MAG: ATP-binding protein [Xenococcaceae cyanobacterium MO_207.B15]|nr:ATP-binding protein [Xenococcaceae cyanobacterium MO_207.B15]